MSDNQVIPEAAVEAAAIAVYELTPVELFGREHPITWEQLSESPLGQRRKDNELTKARAALEAAAPHMLAEAWEAGAKVGFDSTTEGFNGECAFDHCAPDSYPPANPYSGNPWVVSK